MFNRETTHKEGQMIKHIVICDRCGKEVDLDYGLKVPQNWFQDDLQDKDLCPKCYKEYKKYLEGFK